ncbi:phage head-tail joining protein [Paracoccus sp. SM22M-07]|uniref:phage head-tail joining protein n=1 Tax=Paracoccus sp. SM22M-07 TaxID=1520813 RepID=UPI00352A335F
MRMAQLNGERVEFKTDAEMASALGDLEARIARASGPRRRNVLRFSTGKGF